MFNSNELIKLRCFTPVTEFKNDEKNDIGRSKSKRYLSLFKSEDAISPSPIGKLSEIICYSLEIKVYSDPYQDLLD